MPDQKRVTYVCSSCGSDNVVYDAWATWDPDEQTNVLHSSFDDTHCEDCDGSTSAEEMTIPTTATVFETGNDKFRVLWADGSVSEEAHATKAEAEAEIKALEADDDNEEAKDEASCD